jgi:hypothetical protein
MRTQTQMLSAITALVASIVAARRTYRDFRGEKQHEQAPRW